MAALLFGGSARALDVFVTRGEYGELSFSDTAPAPDSSATRLQIAETGAAPDAVARSALLTSELLTTAEALEQARLRREAARTAQQALARTQDPPPVVEEPERRVVVGWPWHVRPRGFHGFTPHVPVHPHPHPHPEGAPAPRVASRWR